MRKDTYKFNPAFSFVFEYIQGLTRCGSETFSQVSKLQYEYRKKLFDLYLKYKDNKTDIYFKELRLLEKEQKKMIQSAAKEIYDTVKNKLGHEIKTNGKTIINKYNFWLYKGNTGMKISILLDNNKIMSLKCGRDINHEVSGVKEKIKVIIGNEDKLNKKKNKENFLEFEANNAEDIINIYKKCLIEILKK